MGIVQTALDVTFQLYLYVRILLYPATPSQIFAAITVAALAISFNVWRTNKFYGQ